MKKNVLFLAMAGKAMVIAVLALGLVLIGCDSGGGGSGGGGGSIPADFVGTWTGEGWGMRDDEGVWHPATSCSLAITDNGTWSMNLYGYYNTSGKCSVESYRIHFLGDDDWWGELGGGILVVDLPGVHDGYNMALRKEN